VRSGSSDLGAGVHTRRVLLEAGRPALPSLSIVLISFCEQRVLILGVLSCGFRVKRDVDDFSFPCLDASNDFDSFRLDVDDGLAALLRSLRGDPL